MMFKRKNKVMLSHLNQDGYSDAFDGSAGDDVIEGGLGDDLLGGGKDMIFSAAGLNWLANEAVWKEAA